MTDHALDTLADRQLGFYSSLVTHSWVLPSLPGLTPGLGPQAVAVYDGLSALLSRTAQEQYSGGELNPVYFPPLFSTHMLEQTEYVESFPQLLGTVDAFHGGTTEHRRMLSAFDRGDDWQAFLAPTGLALASAGCHPLYGYLEGMLAHPFKVYELTGTCFRHEPSADPLRMISFRMREYVRIGTADTARAHRELWLLLGRGIFESLGLEVEIATADDTYFGHRGARGDEPYEPKYELVAEIYPGERTALASANYHGTHFGSTFDIGLADGSIAHSACACFGLDRIVLALAARHGFDSASWPSPVRAALGLVAPVFA